MIDVQFIATEYRMRYFFAIAKAMLVCISIAI